MCPGGGRSKGSEAKVIRWRKSEKEGLETHVLLVAVRPAGHHPVEAVAEAISHIMARGQELVQSKLQPQARVGNRERNHVRPHIYCGISGYMGIAIGLAVAPRLITACWYRLFILLTRLALSSRCANPISEEQRHRPNLSSPVVTFHRH